MYIYVLESFIIIRTSVGFIRNATLLVLSIEKTINRSKFHISVRSRSNAQCGLWKCRICESYETYWDFSWRCNARPTTIMITLGKFEINLKIYIEATFSVNVRTCVDFVEYQSYRVASWTSFQIKKTFFLLNRSLRQRYLIKRGQLSTTLH